MWVYSKFQIVLRSYIHSEILQILNSILTYQTNYLVTREGFQLWDKDSSGDDWTFIGDYTLLLVFVYSECIPTLLRANTRWLKSCCNLHVGHLEATKYLANSKDVVRLWSMVRGPLKQFGRAPLRQIIWPLSMALHDHFVYWLTGRIQEWINLESAKDNFNEVPNVYSTTKLGSRSATPHSLTAGFNTQWLWSDFNKSREWGICRWGYDSLTV